MTLAICIECGAEKVGAFTVCAACGFTPSTPEEPPFDDQWIEELAEQIREGPDLSRGPLGCRIAVWSLIAIMILLALYVFVF